MAEADQERNREEERREACKTHCHKINLVKQRLFASVNIARHTKHLMYYAPIQIQCDVNLEVPKDKLEPVMHLAVLITDTQIDSADMMNISPDSLVTVSYDKASHRRNVFACVSVARTKPGTPVMYGHDFYIRLYDSQGSKLYLTGNLPRLDNFSETRSKISVGLTDKPDRFAKFRIVDLNADRMNILKGTPVRNFNTVCITQTATNQLLAVDMSKKITSSFGVDHPVVCYTHKDPQHRVASENNWKFVVQAIDKGAGDSRSNAAGSSN